MNAILMTNKISGVFVKVCNFEYQIKTWLSYSELKEFCLVQATAKGGLLAFATITPISST